MTQKGGVDTNFPVKRVSDITTINFNFVNLPLIVGGNTKTNTIGLDKGGDTIRGSLSSSGAAYDLANVGDWINVTQAEYNNLLTIVPGSSRNGYGLTGSVTSGWTQNYTIETSVTVPVSSYIVGVYIRPAPTATVNNSVRIKTSPQQYSGFSNYNSTLTVSPSNPYNVVKRPQTVVTGVNIALYTGSVNGTLGVLPNTTTAYYWGNGDVSAIVNHPVSNGGSQPTWQATTTTQKSW